MSTKLERVFAVIKQKTGLTELEIARQLYGPTAVQQMVNQECRMLVAMERVQRVGLGGPGQAFIYEVS